MRPFSFVLNMHIGQLRNSPAIYRHLLQTADPQALVTYRDGGDGWTAAEVIGHLLDCERLFLERAQLVMVHDFPVLPFPDQDEDVIKGRYNKRDPLETSQAWQQVRGEYVAYLETVPETGWSREGRHPIYEPTLSLLEQLFVACWHDTLHAEQITRILAEKRVS